MKKIIEKMQHYIIEKAIYYNNYNNLYADDVKKCHFYIAKIEEKLKEIKCFLIALTTLEKDEKPEDRNEVYKKIIDISKILFDSIKQYDKKEYSKMENFKNFQYIIFSKKTLILILNQFSNFYNDFTSLLDSLKKELENLDTKNKEKNVNESIEIDSKIPNSNDEFEYYLNDNSNLKPNEYEEDNNNSTNYYSIIQDNFYNSTSNSNINEFENIFENNIEKIKKVIPFLREKYIEYFKGISIYQNDEIFSVFDNEKYLIHFFNHHLIKYEKKNELQWNLIIENNFNSSNTSLDFCINYLFPFLLLHKIYDNIFLIYIYNIEKDTIKKKEVRINPG